MPFLSKRKWHLQMVLSRTQEQFGRYKICNQDSRLNSAIWTTKIF